MATKPKCGHRSFGGVAAKGGGYLLRCKACGLTTTTVRPDLTTAAINKLGDFADASALAVARSKATARKTLSDAEAERKAREAVGV